MQSRDESHRSPARSVTRALRLLAAASLGLVLTAGVSAAEKASSSRKSKVASEVTAQKGVETLAEMARRSVVVITHFGRDGREDGVGTGFVVSSNGLIATSLHVIGEARPVQVQLADGRRYEVTEVHAWDRQLDLAVIRVDAAGLPALPLGDSDTLRQGTPIVAMGNPLGLEHSIVQGVISAKREFDGVEMIQLAIPVEPGNSGGPLLDLQGRVQGIITLKAMSANLGFAMPINALKPLLQRPNPVPMNHWLTLGALSPREWTPLLGARWSKKAGRIQVDGPGTGFGGRSLCLWRKEVPTLPYEVAVTVKLDDESGAAGLVFGSDGADKHYGFYPSAGQLRLTRFDGPNVFSWTILKQAPSAAYRPGEWNRLKVRAEKGKIRCYVNGELAAESDEEAPPGGRVGLAKFRDTKAMFKDFQLGTNLVSSPAADSAELNAQLRKQIGELAAQPEAQALRALSAHAEASQPILAERARRLEAEAARLRQLAAQLRRQSVQDELVRRLHAPEDQVDLFDAALLVSKLDKAELDTDAYRRQLEEMARELSGQLPAKAANAAKLTALKKYLFEENGFHGSRTDYYNRANSYMDEVLDDREGLPITLSVLFLELARRIGLDGVTGLPLPGHFMVKYTAPNGDEQIIDVWDGGRPKTMAEVGELVESFTGEPLRDEFLKPARKREIIIRMLRNLHGIAQRSQPSADALRYLDLIVALAPDSASERLERASLRLQGGDTAGAKADFKWILDNAPAGINLERIAELFRSL